MNILSYLPGLTVTRLDIAQHFSFILPANVFQLLPNRFFSPRGPLTPPLMTPSSSNISQFQIVSKQEKRSIWVMAEDCQLPESIKACEICFKFTFHCRHLAAVREIIQRIWRLSEQHVWVKPVALFSHFSGVKTRIQALTNEEAALTGREFFLDLINQRIGVYKVELI